MRPYLLNLPYKRIAMLLIGGLLSLQSFSQHLVIGNAKFKVEAGLNFGPTFFLGDLGGNAGKGTRFIKDVNLELTKMMKGAFVTVYPTDWLGLRVAGQLTYVSGQDYIINTNGNHESWRKERNLDFKSNMWEVYGAIELYPTLLFRKYNDYEPRLRPYGFFGIGLFHFDPKGSITASNGTKTWHKLHPLRTEGQGMTQYPNKKPYELTQINVPMGFGLKYDLSEKVTVGAELLYRHTFTDYIDDVSTTYIDPVYFGQYLSPQDAAIARKIHDKMYSIMTANVSRFSPGTQRGNAKQNDAYFSTLLKIGVKLGNSGVDNKALRQTRCPLLY
ncbi:MAG: hypothetical protein EOO06_18015 [Chitinophagaceae bacterium]|nr:MAG: hypothetical protein EOO06_18015 [Chitinophagaceae bacterium]